MSNDNAVTVFTAKSIETILRDGGSSSWRVDPNRVREYTYLVCTRNAKLDWVEGPEPHRFGFFIGKISGVVPTPGDSSGRSLIQVDAYARIAVPNAWLGDRNPVRYMSLSDIGIDPATITWEAMPNSTPQLTFNEARVQLARTYGVRPGAVEITIRG